nr:immunoglobulin heavy chain junction region [Mus musculus]
CASPLYYSNRYWYFDVW